MGLLDDAIREHLELKRRRGADAGEVAREEHEVLDTPSGSPGEHFPEDPGLEESLAPASSQEVQETEELDMKPLLEDEPVAIPDDASGDFMGAAGDALEWHSPHDDATAPQVAAEGATADAGDGESADEDVLEETPEFLRETPEQDRLWFEQRPPRDFDFDG
jgi:hypothetical protein